MRARAALTVLAGLFLSAAPARADTNDDLVSEIEARFKGARKWFGMVSDLKWDRAADGTLSPRTNELSSPIVVRRDPAGQSIDAALPPDSARPLRVALREGGPPGFWVRAVEVGAPAVPVAIARGVAVYRGAVPGGDLLYKATPTHLDEYVYYRSPPAKLSRRFEIELGPAVAEARAVGDWVELVDKEGVSHLRVGAPLARAADGARRRGTVRVSGRTLVEELDLAGLVAPVLVDPDWSTTGSMTVAHWGDGAWRRTDGRVMAVGGCALAACPMTFAGAACSQVIASTDVWDPQSGTWTSGAALTTARYDFAYAELPGGDFLVVGGCTETGCASTTALAERYVGGMSAWIPAGSIDSPRANAVAAAVAGGDVLVAGGCTTSSCSASAQRYSPGANGWSAAAPLPAARGYAAATSLADGRVLVTGGCATADCSTILDDALVYDPSGNAWSSAGKMASPRAGHTATRLADGAVLVAGGCTDAACTTTLDSVDLWSSPNGFSAGPKMASVRHDHTATLLGGGQLLVAGGGGNGMTTATAEVYYPSAKQWVKPSSMLMDRAFHVAAPLVTGDVLVAGGCNPQTCLPFAEVFSPANLPGDNDAGVSYDAGPPPPPPASDAGLLVGKATSPHPPLHRTGVTTCATDTTQDLPCPAPGWPLEDGEFQPNAKSFDAVAGGAVRDPLTGLVWQADDGGDVYTQEAAIARCAALSTPDAPAGSWRLPTVIELLTLLDYSRNNPSIDPKFPGTQPTNYWTASVLASSQKLRWTVKFDFGEVVPLLGDTKLPARCVRGQTTSLGATRKGGPMVASADTVADQRTGLEWQRRDDGQKRRWRDALSYCASLSSGGHTDWHVPNVAELESIVEYGGGPGDVRIDPVFENTAPDIYWSSTQNEGAPTLSWSVTFNLGVVDGVTVSGLAHVRCVRHLATASASGGCGCHAGAADALGEAPLALVPLALLARRRRRASSR